VNKLVELIEKTAQELADPPGVATKGKTPAVKSNDFVGPLQGGPAKAKSAPGYAPNKVIKNMQLEVVNFANLVAAENAFDDFVAKHYLKDADIITAIKSITRSSLGKPFADGSWGPKTNAALINVYNFTVSLLQLAKDFKLSLRSYDQANLNNFKTCIPEHDTDQGLTWKIEAAGLIIKHLQAIEKMYNEVKSAILQNPQFAANVAGDQPYITYQKKNADLTDQQMNALRQTFYKGFTIPTQNGNTTIIEVNDLKNLNTLKAWVAIHAPTQDPYNVLTIISDQLNKEAK
jgi:hypothetical protein